MSDNMNEKYQQHYNKILTGTLTDTIMKSISYQANIQLANEIIAEQEKTTKDLEKSLEESKKELESLKTNKTNSDNSRIFMLENQVESHSSTISKLQNDLFEANKLRTDYENVKHQVQHLDTYRNEVIKAREENKKTVESHQKTCNDYEAKIAELNAQIELLKTPAKKKKVSEVTVTEEPVIIETKPKAKIIKQDLPGLIVKDGGSF